MVVFVKGMRVIATHNFDESNVVEDSFPYPKIRKGMKGTVVANSDGGFAVEVDWDELTTGHNCCGKARNGHGYNVTKVVIEPAENYIKGWE